MVLADHVLKWVAESVGGDVKVLSATRLLGGISAALHSIDLLVNGELQTVVLRQFTNQEWLRHQPHLAQQEADSLAWAQRVGVPAPQLIAYRQSDVPAVLMTKLSGTVELQPERIGQTEQWLEQLAETLVRIHAIPAESCERSYFPWNDRDTLGVPEWSDQKDVWQQAFDIVQGPIPQSRLHLIHRDYHPTNVLWQEGKVSGVVDWVNACRGPAGVDVGHCRLNLAVLKGVEAADLFLEKYQKYARDSFAYEPYWDLVSIMDWLPHPPGVYQGWVDLGITDLNPAITKQRYEQFVASVVSRREAK